MNASVVIGVDVKWRRRSLPAQIVPVGRPLPALIECAPKMVAGRRVAGFTTTSWTLIRAAGKAGGTEALAELCQRYWPPVYAFVRGRGHDPDNARDLTQGFFAALLE